MYKLIIAIAKYFGLILILKYKWPLTSTASSVLASPVDCKPMTTHLPILWFSSATDTTCFTLVFYKKSLVSVYFDFFVKYQCRIDRITKEEIISQKRIQNSRKKACVHHILPLLCFAVEATFLTVHCIV